jgi:hypothetical protein
MMSDGNIPGINETREYWYVHNRSTGWPRNIIYKRSSIRDDSLAY